MSISQGFLDNLDKLMCYTDEPCTCEKCGEMCPSCYAQQEIDGIYLLIENALENIERKHKI